MANWQCLPACLRRIKSGGKRQQYRPAGLQFQATTQSEPHMHAWTHKCWRNLSTYRSLCCIIYFVCLSAWLSIPVRSRDGSDIGEADRHDSDARSRWPPLPIRRRQICVAFDEHARTDPMEERWIDLRAALWHHAPASSIIVLLGGHNSIIAAIRLVKPRRFPYHNLYKQQQSEHVVIYSRSEP
jgi:hypothetical protein